MNKPENNSFNKAKFFAQYFGQRVLIRDGKGPYDVLRLMPHDLLVPPEDYLELRSVADLTDEEKDEFKRLADQSSDSRIGNQIDMDGYIYAIDYLRRLGVLVPFDGLSTTDLIDYGWAKIKEVNP